MKTAHARKRAREPRQAAAGRLGFTSALLAGVAVSGIMTRANAQELIPASAGSDVERVYELSIPLLFQDRRVGQVRTRVTDSGLIGIHAGDLRETLRPLVPAQVLADFSAVESDYVSTERVLEQTGIDVSYDEVNLTIIARAGVHSETDQRVALTPRRTGVSRIDLEPQNFAVGITGAIRYEDDLGDAALPRTGVTADFIGFANVGGIEGINFDFAARRTLEDGGTWERGRMVAFKDFPARTLRLEAGDIFDADLNSVILAPEFFGVSLNKSYAQLSPSRNVRPTGATEVFLERESRVDVLVNGALAGSVIANPGRLSLDDIPFAAESNDVQIVVEDEFGRTEVQSFGFTSSRNMLAKDISEYNGGLGVLRNNAVSGFEYSDRFVATGSYRRGMSDGLTATLAAQLTDEGGAVSAGGITSFAGGVIDAQLATSSFDGAAGVAAALDFSLDDPFNVDQFAFFNARLDVASKEFRTAQDALLQAPIKIRARASYRQSVSEGLTGSVGIQYSETFEENSDVGQVSFGLTKLFNQFSASLLTDYSFGSASRDDFRAFISISRRLGQRSTARTAYDTASERASAEYRRQPTSGIGSVGVNAKVISERYVDTYQGAATYRSNRADLNGRIDYRENSTGRSDGTASVGVQSGIAFTNNRLAIGRDPGRGFFMISRHSSLSDAKVSSYKGSRYEVTSRSDGLGPILVPVERSYQQDQVRLQVDDVPLGYDLGQSEYTAEPGARSGYSIMVGDDAYRSARGYLLYKGEPVALASGILRLVGAREDQTKSIFTNREGRFFINGLKEGIYEVALNGPYSAIVRIEISGDNPLIDLGNVEVAQ